MRGTESLLFVEDDVEILDLAATYLEGLGYSVNKAQSGTEAVILCQSRSNPFEIIITDVVMPKMSGVELFERIHRKWQVTKVLFISGYSKDYHAYSREMGHKYPYLQKPFQFSSLAKKVREILDSSVQDV